jgi:hypothetical protein
VGLPRPEPEHQHPAVDPAACGAWIAALDAARGRHSLAAFEKLYTDNYLPLVRALAGGHEDAKARRARDEFRTTFARAYTDAIPTFTLTGKRPRLVLDAPDDAAKLGRAGGARAIELVLVSGMRFDVGQRMIDALRQALPKTKSGGDGIFWSLLPTTTTRQLDALARGERALRSEPPPLEDEDVRAHPRSPEVVRRIRVGRREMCKLDVVEEMIARPPPDSGDVHTLLARAADAAAAAIARHAATLAPNTLLFVFGDRGFVLDRAGEARCGGASPEEVLVPAYALFIPSDQAGRLPKRGNRG